MEAAQPQVSIDDTRIRFTNWTFGGDGASTGTHRHEFDYVVVPVTGGVFIVTDADGSVHTMTQIAGLPYAGKAGTSHEVTNTPGAPAVFVEVELKQ